ncbi:restriction endonuclease subunit S, partial [Lactococcus cremoris]
MAKIDDSVKKKVPELRFPGFTYDWEERKLSDIADRFDNLRVPITASDRKPGDTPYYGANGIQDYVEGFTHNGEFILVAEDGANDLKNYPVQYVNGKVWVNNHAHVLQGKKTITDNKFLMNAIKNFNIEPFLVGGGRAKLNADVMMKLNILLPTFVEQEKIGSLFSLLDKTIALHQRKLDLLKEQKKGYLQKMFPKNGAKVPELRFAGFADDWEERKLGDITKISTGKLDANAMVENGKYDFYTSGIKKYRIDVAAFEGPSITIAGNGATVGYMHLADNKFNAYQRTYVLQEFLVDRSFIFSEIGNKLPKKIKQEARTGNIPYIVMDMLTELKLSIPQNNSEQQKIGSFFKQLDDTID